VGERRCLQGYTTEVLFWLPRGRATGIRLTSPVSVFVRRRVICRFPTRRFRSNDFPSSDHFHRRERSEQPAFARRRIPERPQGFCHRPRSRHSGSVRSLQATDRDTAARTLIVGRRGLTDRLIHFSSRRVATDAKTSAAGSCAARGGRSAPTIVRADDRTRVGRVTALCGMSGDLRTPSRHTGFGARSEAQPYSHIVAMQSVC